MSTKRKFFFEEHDVDTAPGEDAVEAGQDEADGYTDEEAAESDYEDATVENAIKLVSEGEKMLVERKNAEAAECLSRAVAILSANYGDAADECADAFFLYGKALYECAIEKGGLFSSDPAKHPKEGQPLKIEKFVSQEEEDNGDEENGTDETDDLQLAFEVLTLAQSTYERLGEQVAGKRLAEVLILLGNIHLELENGPDATAYFEQAIGVRMRMPNVMIRDLLEARYYYAIGLQSVAQYAIALKQIQTAEDELEKEVYLLTKLAESKPVVDNGKGKGNKMMLQSLSPEAAKSAMEELKSLKKILDDKKEDLELTIELLEKANSAAATEEIRTAARFTLNGAGSAQSPEGKGKASVNTEEPKAPSAQDENISRGFAGVASNVNVVNVTQFVRKKRKSEVTDEKKVDEAPAKKEKTAAVSEDTNKTVQT